MATQTETTATATGDPEYREARQRAETLQGLYIHLLVYAVINGGLFVLNWATRGEGGAWWFYWPLLGWGIGVLIHVLTAVAPVFSPEWADRRARQMLSRKG